MSLEEFQLKGDTTYDTSIIKRDYMKIYHQQGDLLSNSNQGNDFNFG